MIPQPADVHSRVEATPWPWYERPTGLPYPLRIRDVVAENHRTRTIVLDASIAAEPGQFAMLWLPGLDEKPFSLRSAAPLAFTIAAVGPFSRAVHGLGIGDRIWFRGPFGRGFELEGRDHLMVGGGYGVAPLLYLAQQALAHGDRVRAVIGARVAADLLLADAFHAVGAEVHLATEDGSSEKQGRITPGGSTHHRVTQGRVTDIVGPLIAADRPSTLYACGPHGMLDALAAQSAAARLPAQLAWEAYMRCGIGICGSCEHGGRLVCTDGPVERRA
jgi:dihydroorotate dehydrogenase electron transfer subunit